MQEIRYFEPLERAYRRMVDQLFRPFDLAKWLVLGFSCWLARLAQGGGSGGFQVPAGDWSGGDSEGAVREALGAASRLSEPLGLGLPEAGLVGCVILLVVVALAVLVTLIWVSSRGQFLFIDNAVHGRAHIAAPWRQFRRQGNSLFLWQLGYVAIALVTLVAAAIPAIVAGVAGAFDEGGALAVAAGATTGLLVLGWIITLLYVSFFLIGFVVPIMYRERLTTNAAWRVFLPVLREHAGRFVVAGLFFLLVHLVVGIAVVIACVATCCVLLIVLILPYVGTVAMLPIYLSYRLFTLEFLAQFSPRFDFFDARDTLEIPLEIPVEGQVPPPPEAEPAD